MVNNPPSNAGDAGSIPDQGTKIPHAVGQLSPRTTTIELAHLNETPQLERNPYAAPREKTRADSAP